MTIDAKTEVPAASLGLVIGVSRKRVEQLASTAVIPKTGKGRFPLVEGIRAYVGWLQNSQRQAARSAAGSAVLIARAEEIRLRNADRKRQMVEQAQHEAIRVIDEIAGPLRSDIMAIPAQVTDDLALRRKIEDQFDEAFGAASKRASKAATLLRTMGAENSARDK